MGTGDVAASLWWRTGYSICVRKGWSAGGQIYNALVASWRVGAEAASKVERVVPVQKPLLTL